MHSGGGTLGWAEEKRRLPQSVRPMRRRRRPGPAPRGANGRRQSRPSRGREQGCAKRRPPPSWPSSGDVFAVVRWRASVGPCCATSVRVETGGARLCLPPAALSGAPPASPSPRWADGRAGARLGVWVSALWVRARPANPAPAVRKGFCATPADAIFPTSPADGGRRLPSAALTFSRAGPGGPPRVRVLSATSCLSFPTQPVRRQEESAGLCNQSHRTLSPQTPAFLAPPVLPRFPPPPLVLVEAAWDKGAQERKSKRESLIR